MRNRLTNEYYENNVYDEDVFEEQEEEIALEKAFEYLLTVSSATIKLQVTLGKADSEKRFISRFKSFIYRTNKYKDRDEVKQISAENEIYLVFDFTKKNVHNEVLFCVKDLYKLHDLLNTMMDWVHYDYDKVFVQEEDGSIKVAENLSFAVYNLVQGTSIEIVPYLAKNNGNIIEGVLINVHFKNKDVTSFFTYEDVRECHAALINLDMITLGIEVRNSYVGPLI